MTDKIIGILLAAGQSTRFGSNKLLHTLPDSQQAIAVQSAQNLLQALPTSLAVIRSDDRELKSALSTTGIHVVENPEAESGMSSSIRCGIESILTRKPDSGDTVKGWVIALADMPHIPSNVIINIVQHISNGALICAPQYKGRRGHPVGFSDQFTNELLALKGDKGARQILDTNKDQIKFIDSPDDGILFDIDSEEDISR